LVANHEVMLAFRSPDFPQGSYQAYGSKNYQFQSVPPPNAALPTSVPPVAGAVPLYDFTFANGKHNYLTTPPAVFSGASILGYLFNSQQAGTVALHKYTHTSNGDVYLTKNQSSYASYTYNGIVGYVYSSQILNTEPIYQHLTTSYIHRYQNQPGIIAANDDFEGVQFYMLQSIQVTTNPVPIEGLLELYQYYGGTYKDHFYTTKKQAYAGYTYERVLGYIHQTQVYGTVPLYRYYNDIVNDHFYTVVQQNYTGYHYEGITGYVYTNPNASTPVSLAAAYRYYSGPDKDHYYDITGSTPTGYTYEGVEFYLGYFPY